MDLPVDINFVQYNPQNATHLGSLDLNSFSDCGLTDAFTRELGRNEYWQRGGRNTECIMNGVYHSRKRCPWSCCLVYYRSRVCPILRAVNFKKAKEMNCIRQEIKPHPAANAKDFTSLNLLAIMFAIMMLIAIYAGSLTNFLSPVLRLSSRFSP